MHAGRGERGHGGDRACSARYPAAVSSGDLAVQGKKEIAMELVSSAENSSLNWRAQYGYIEDIHDGRGYTAGIIGFCSGTGDMLAVVRVYTRRRPHNPLVRFLAALQRVNSTPSHRGLRANSLPRGSGLRRIGPFRGPSKLSVTGRISTRRWRSPSQTDSERWASSPTTTRRWSTDSTGCRRSAHAPSRTPGRRPTGATK